MENEQILLQFRMLFNRDFGFQVLGSTYVVSSEGIFEGELKSIVTRIEDDDIALMFSHEMKRDSGIDFLINLLKTFAGVREGHSDIKGILSGTLMATEHPESVEKLIGKRMDYLKITPDNDYAVSNLVEATLTDAIWVKDALGYIVFVCRDLDERSIDGLLATIQTELFEDCQWLIGNVVETHEAIYPHGNWLRDSVQLLDHYNLRASVITLKNIVPYKLIDACPDRIKGELLDYNITQELLLDDELSATIEMLFEEELNLTDTAKALFIHRNTLLYRLDKIQKLTTFDLRKFSDSFVFKILWLLNQK